MRDHHVNSPHAHQRSPAEDESFTLLGEPCERATDPTQAASRTTEPGLSSLPTNKRHAIDPTPFYRVNGEPQRLLTCVVDQITTLVNAEVTTV
jgi:hypothetical protein